MILTDHVTHRPFPLPEQPWVMHQAWNDFLFLHWEVDPDEVRRAVPAPLELDLRDGKCFVGIIPFHMTDVRPRGTVNVPGVSAFPELNVRTYVVANGKPGVYFCLALGAVLPAHGLTVRGCVYDGCSPSSLASARCGGGDRGEHDG